MDEQKFEKSIKNAKWFAVGIMVLIIIVFVLSLFVIKPTTTSIIMRIVQLAICVGAIIGFSKRTMLGPICGIIVSIFLILSFSIELIFGILYLIDCIKIIKYMKN